MQSPAGAALQALLAALNDQKRLLAAWLTALRVAPVEPPVGSAPPEPPATAPQRSAADFPFFFGVWEPFLYGLNTHKQSVRRSKDTCKGDPRPEASAQSYRGLLQYLGMSHPDTTPHMVD